MEAIPRSGRRAVRFGLFELDLGSGELRRGDTRIRLQEQPFQILTMLLQRPGEVVTREELRQQLWPHGTFVDFEHSLNAAVKRLREALNDDAENPRFVETLPRRGYRFIAPVSDGTDTAPTGRTGIRLVRTPWAALVVTVVLAGAVYLAWQRSRPRPSLPARAIMLAVLPFENFTGDAQQEYFSDGLTEEMIAELSRLQPERLAVIARTTVAQYKGTKKTIRQIGKELGVDYVLESSVARAENRVRIHVRLIRVKDQTHVWANSYDREMQDSLALEAEVTRAISKEIALQLSPEQQVRLARGRQLSPDAHEAYLKGLFFFDKLTESGLKKSIEYFQQAIDKEPSYAKPYARMARAYGLLGHFSALRPEQAYPRQTEAALKAIELDGTLDEARSALGWSKLFYERDWPGAREEFQRAVELSPNSATAHQAYAAYFVAMGQFEHALAEILRAQQLDPVSLTIKTDVGWYLFFARRSDESIAQLRRVLEMDPHFSVAHFCLAQALEQKGMFDQAIAEFQTSQEGEANMSRLSLGGRAYALAGRNREARQVLRKLEAMRRVRYVSPYYMALIYAGLGQNDEAFDWLESAYRDRFWMMAFTKVDPRLDGLRSDRRFQDLLRRMNFPD